MMSALLPLSIAFWDVTMKSLTLTYLFTSALFMTGCQSFQFVESPIPVKNAPSKNLLVKTAPVTDMTVENNEHEDWYKKLTIKKANIDLISAFWYLLLNK